LLFFPSHFYHRAKKSKEQIYLIILLPFKTLNFSLPHTADLSKRLGNSEIKIGGLRPPTFMDNNNNNNILVLQTNTIILDNE